MLKRIIQKAVPFVSIVIFGLALWFLHHELRNYRYHEILHHLKSIPPDALWLAFIFTGMSYLFLVGYDLLAFAYVGRKLELKKVALTSFVSYAFSNTIGHSLITGGSVRYRLYSAWGISGEDISKIVAFCTVTFWIGVLSLGGLLFVAAPISLPVTLPIHSISPVLVGLVSLGLLAAYFLVILIKRNDSVVLFGWSWNIPRPGLAAGQVVISGFDWLFSAGVLFILLPPSPGVTFLSFLGIYTLGTVFALISQVPAGLGVFETIVVVLLAPVYPATIVVSALLAYSLAYLLPGPAGRGLAVVRFV